MTELALEVGIHWDDLPVGTRFHTKKRTVTETDLVNFVNLTWLTEELFGNADPQDRARMGITGRVVPGGLVYTFAEGLVAPTFVGDTLHVVCEVIEQRATSKPDRGLVRTRNTVLNQQGQVVLVYTPLRMMRRRASAQ